MHCWDRNVHCLSKHIPLSFLSESLLTKENIAMVMRTAKILARASHHFHPSACMYIAYPGVSVQRKVKKKLITTSFSSGMAGSETILWLS